MENFRFDPTRKEKGDLRERGDYGGTFSFFSAEGPMGSFSSFEGHYDSAFFLTCYFLFDIPTLFYWMSSGWDTILQCNFVAIIFTVLVGYRETAEPSSRLVHARVLAQVLCQVLHAGSQPHWGRVHQVPFWPTDQTRFGNGSITMQRQYGSSHGLIHCPRYSFTFFIFTNQVNHMSICSSRWRRYCYLCNISEKRGKTRMTSS